MINRFTNVYSQGESSQPLNNVGSQESEKHIKWNDQGMGYYTLTTFFFLVKKKKVSSLVTEKVF